MKKRLSAPKETTFAWSILVLILGLGAFFVLPGLISTGILIGAFLFLAAGCKFTNFWGKCRVFG